MPHGHPRLPTLPLLVFGIAAWFFLSVPARADDSSGRDPWQPFNHAIYTFNETADRYVGRPVARGYQKVTPQLVDDTVTRFFNNIGDVGNVANFLLQGEGKNAATSFGRVVINTSFGVGGLIDWAAHAAMPRRDTSFGTTLGKWGVGSGPYLVLPFRGPSTVRDTFGMPVDMTLNPLVRPITLVPDATARLSMEAVDIVDMRADLLDYENAVVGDRYTFLRDLYLQHRDYEIHGAPAKDPFLDDDGGE